MLVITESLQLHLKTYTTGLSHQIGFGELASFPQCRVK